MKILTALAWIVTIAFIIICPIGAVAMIVQGQPFGVLTYLLLWGWQFYNLRTMVKNYKLSRSIKAISQAMVDVAPIAHELGMSKDDINIALKLLRK